MIVLGWLVAIVVCLVFHWTNGLLAIIAITLVEIAVTAGQLRQGVTELCRMLKDDEPDLEGLLTQFDKAVKRMDDAPEGYTAIAPDTFVRKDETAPQLSVSQQVIHRAPSDWLQPWIKES